MNLTINGDFAARIAPLLREEYPERMEPEARYVALNKERRAIIITHESIVIREDEVEDPVKSIDVILKTLGQLSDIIDWADGALTTVTFGAVHASPDSASFSVERLS